MTGVQTCALPICNAIRALFSFLFSVGIVALGCGVLFTVGMVALITWVVKKIWYSDEKQHQNAGSCNQSSKKKKQYIPDNGYEGNRKEGVRWYPTGWTYNTKTGKWEPPNYLQDQSKEKWEWDEDKQIWIDKEKEARLEKYRKYHEGQPPTFEEWTAARKKENSNN